MNGYNPKNRKKIAVALSAIILTSQAIPVNALTNDKLENKKSTYTTITSLIASKDTEAPTSFQISKNDWDGSPNYTITMNMWYGVNGDVWKLYENGVLIAEVPLINNTPAAQTAQYTFTDSW